MENRKGILVFRKRAGLLRSLWSPGSLPGFQSPRGNGSGGRQKINRYISEMYSTSEAVGTARKRKKECDWWAGIQF